nr:MAG TPA: hypothetical protein [Caudoviricetes sp.]
MAYHFLYSLFLSFYKNFKFFFTNYIFFSSFLKN